MNQLFFWLTVCFIIVAVAMILIILVQRPAGGGLAGAFGGAGGTGADTVFGGRVGDALTTMTICAFVAYLGLAVWLNKVPSQTAVAGPAGPGQIGAPVDGAPVAPPVVTGPDGQPIELTPIDASEVPAEYLEGVPNDRLPPEVLERLQGMPEGTQIPTEDTPATDDASTGDEG